MRGTGAFDGAVGSLPNLGRAEHRASAECRGAQGRQRWSTGCAGQPRRRSDSVPSDSRLARKEALGSTSVICLFRSGAEQTSGATLPDLAP